MIKKNTLKNYYKYLAWLSFFFINLEIESLYLELFNGVKFSDQTNMLHVHDSSWEYSIEHSAWPGIIPIL